jgi:hypothetical protein
LDTATVVPATVTVCGVLGSVSEIVIVSPLVTVTFAGENR